MLYGKENLLFLLAMKERPYMYIKCQLLNVKCINLV